jgi:hypothetical protein
MRGSVAARPVYPADRSAVGEISIEGGRRLAVAVLLFLTGVMFAMPPGVAVLVLAGAIR